MSTMKPPALRYTDQESTDAHKEWKASCGHHSIAAIAGLSLDEVRKAIPDEKGWMNPTNVADCLKRLKLDFRITKGLKVKVPKEGVNRIQWEGKWLDPGKPPAVAYHYTHWVAFKDGHVLDTVLHPAQWIELEFWLKLIDEYSTEKPSTGWHITHHYEIKDPS